MNQAPGAIDPIHPLPRDAGTGRRECETSTGSPHHEEIGRVAVRTAVADEHPSGSIVIKRTGTAKTYAVSYVWTELENIAGPTRQMPDEFINAEANGVTEAFRDYALPLLGRLPRLGWLRGKPIR